MAIWLTALKAIPWTALLARTPVVVRAANTLLAGSRAERQQVEDRIALLEQQHDATASLLKDLSDQIDALTAASEVMAARMRLMAIVLVLTFVVAGVALVIAISLLP
jgi:hypothetical protein